jgi:COP9 signalosome complex subunit 3
VNPLLTSIFRIDPTSGTLTSTHLKLLRICLSQRMYREALPVLEVTIHSFPPNKGSQIDGQFLCSPHTDSSAYITEASGLSDKITTYDVHEYFLLGAMIYIGLQQWEDARLYLECVLISPSQGSPSVLQVEAYKKWTLVGCIMKGVVCSTALGIIDSLLRIIQALDTPKAMNQTTLRNIKAISRAYDAVVEVFQSSNSARLQAEIGAGSQIWYEDGNLGLIQLLTTRLPRFHILDMQKTYSAVPLSDVSKWLDFKVDALHAFIEEMVAEGALNADIDLNGAEPVLRFYSNQSKGPLAKTEKEYHGELLTQTKRTNAMAEYVKMSDRRLTLTKEYIHALRRQMRNKDGEGGLMAPEALDDARDLDEDIMMDE